MTSIKDEAKKYEPPETLNVAELSNIPIDLELLDEVGKAGTPDEFHYKYIMVKGKKYRMPGIVLGDIKALLAKIPTLRAVEVLRTGTGLQTRYQVIPYTDQPTETKESTRELVS